MDIKRIFNLIDERKDELFALLSSLIKINSENFRYTGNEKEIAEYVYSSCLNLGLESEIYSPLDVFGFKNHPDYQEGRNLEERYSVTARWKGKTNRDSLMLMGHIDTVEIGDIKYWTKNPLSGEISDGKIWGRGACDDKYAIAVVLFLIKLLKAEGFEPKENLLFAAYSDEEHGGSHGALATVLKYPCPHIVNMDTGEGELCHCSAGGQGLKYLFHTKDITDSAYVAASAIPVILAEIERFAKKRREEIKNNPYYENTELYTKALRYMGVKIGENGTDLGRGEIHFTFYTDKAKEEIVCELSFLEENLKKKLEPMGIISDGFMNKTRFFHYVYCKPDSSDILRMLKAAEVAGAKQPRVCGSCLSDMSVISKYGSANAFSFGIGRDFAKYGGAHQPDEFVETAVLLEYTKTIAAYIIDVLG